MTDFNLSAWIADVYLEALERGMQPPLIIVAMNLNGSVLVTRWPKEDGDPETLAEHVEAGGFRLPMTFVILDQRNEVLRVGIKLQKGVGTTLGGGRPQNHNHSQGIRSTDRSLEVIF
jgi:hypothetical protein